MTIKKRYSAFQLNEIKRDAIRDLHLLNGTGPFLGDMGNICYADGIFANSLKRKYGVTSIAELEEWTKK